MLAASAPFAVIRLSESASFSFCFLERWCCGLRACGRRSHACKPLLLLLLMLHKLLGFKAWRECGGREMLVFGCVHAREPFGRGGGSMLWDARFVRKDDGGRGSAGECMSVGDGSSNSNLQYDCGINQ